MNFEVDRLSDKWGEPSIAEMVDKSIDILKRGPTGYFLFVEGKIVFSFTVLVYSTLGGKQSWSTSL
jgi:hypothetical protein